MRQITTHQASPLDDALQLYAIDAPTAGGACSDYLVTGVQNMQPLDPSVREIKGEGYLIRVPFQNGPVKENGITGFSNEVLLAIVADRLEGFQAGPYACEDNALALTNIKTAMEALQKRTRERLERNVEGTAQL